MRVTNNMIMDNAASNINGTKELVNQRNTQMTSQKKISKPSEDPVIAVRSLRLSTTLSTVGQYYEKNIPDALSWLSITETALINMKSIVADCRTLCVTGATDTYSEKDRSTLLNQFKSLQQQLYAEGNADYAGRTVFTGFRTDKNLTFMEDELTTKYQIGQTFDIADSMEEFRYYDGEVKLPTTRDELEEPDNIPQQREEVICFRVRLAYDKIKLMSTDIEDTTNAAANDMANIFPQYGSTLLPETPPDKNVYGIILEPEVTGTTVSVFSDMAAWGTGVENIDEDEYEDLSAEDQDKWTLIVDENNDPVRNDDGNMVYWREVTVPKTVGPKEIVVIESTGEMILGEDVAKELMNNKGKISVAYERTGFYNGELRPEYYYNCNKTADDNDKVPVLYTKFDKDGKVINYDIQYTVAQDQTLNVNSEACNVFDSSLQRDLGEMIDAIQATLDAHEKVDRVMAMMEESQYASESCQNLLNEWLIASKREAEYADDNMQKLFSTELGKIDKYYAKINLAITDLGCKGDSLKLTKTRVGEQQETVQELQSTNDDMDLSKIIIQYTAAYGAYQASLTAAGKLGDSTLLNYI